MQYLKNTVTLNLETCACTGCGTCTEVCPHGVFGIENGKAKILDKNSCMECGACGKNCPVSAIDVNAGTGCAFAVIMGWLKGQQPNCDCSSGGTASSCC